jgi:hypothetical protein
MAGRPWVGEPFESRGAGFGRLPNAALPTYLFGGYSRREYLSRGCAQSMTVAGA